MVHSVDANALHVEDPRRWLLEYCSAPIDEVVVKAAFGETESAFERDVLTRIYTRLRTQYPAGGYRIDIVIEGPESRLAIECDGDYWHGPDVWDRDRARRTVLERAGWTFERIRGSAFYRDPEAALERLWHRLDALGIPSGDWAGDLRPGPAHCTWPDDFPDRVAALEDASAERGFTGPAEPGRDGEERPSVEVATAFRSGETRPFEPPPSDWLSPPAVPRASRSPLSIAPSLTAREVRDWARTAGHQVGDRGRLRPSVVDAWNEAFPERAFEK